MRRILLCCISLLALFETASARDYKLEISPDSRQIVLGEQATFTISVISVDGLDTPVDLEVMNTSLPLSAWSLDRERIAPPYQEKATLVVRTDLLTQSRRTTYTIVIEGWSENMPRWDTATLVVALPPGPDVRWFVYDRENSELPSAQIRGIAFDREGSAWIGTSSGLSLAFPNDPPSANKLPLNTVIYAVSIDSTNRLWYSASAGLSPVGVPDSIPLLGAAITRIANAPDGSLWAATGFGLIGYRNGVWTRYTTENSGLTSNIIIDIAVASNGDLWVSLDAGENGVEPGLVKFDGSAWTAYSASDLGLRSDVVPGRIAIDRADRVWVATEQGGVVINGSEIRLDSPGFPVNDITSGPDGRVWVTSTDEESGSRRIAVKRYGGEWTIYTDAGTGIRSGMSFRNLAVDPRNGSLWIGTSGGVVIFRPDVAASVGSERRSAEAGIALSPNPLLSEGKIEVVSRGGAGRIRLYDNLGRSVATLFEGLLPPGALAITFDRGAVPSGTYLMALDIDGRTAASRMIVITR